MRPLHISELTGKPPRKRGTEAADAERYLYFQIVAMHLQTPLRQYRFAKEALGRAWRWDLCWPDRMIAIEIQGGIWTRGAHGHPTDILRNMHKHNDATRLGWRFYQFTPTEVRRGIALKFLQENVL